MLNPTSLGPTGPAAVVWPLGKRRAWGVVLLLALANLISLVDRNFLGMVAERIKTDLSLTDFQVGLLLGPAFATFYVVLGIPLGWLADRVRRPTLLALGMTVWCIATAFSGLTSSFWGLYINRLAVGLGEACLAPCALPLIADYVPPQARGRAVSTYVAGALLGAGSAYLVGGNLVAYLETRGGPILPIFAGFYSWQTALILLGVPGLFVAAAVFCLREPRNMPGYKSNRTGPTPTFAHAIGVMRQQWQAFGGVILCLGCISLVGYTNLWAATLFLRAYDWPIEQIGLMLGFCNLATTPPGAALTGWISDRATKSGKWNGPLISVLVGALMIWPTYFLYPIMPEAWLAVVMFFIGSIGQHVAGPAGPLAIIHISPRPVRSQIVAWYYLFYNVSGLFIGPPIIGFLTGLMGGGTAIRYSISIVGLTFGAVAIWAIWACRRHYAIAAERAAATEP